jgi:hypothetical protein
MFVNLGSHKVIVNCGDGTWASARQNFECQIIEFDSISLNPTTELIAEVSAIKALPTDFERLKRWHGLKVFVRLTSFQMMTDKLTEFRHTIYGVHRTKPWAMRHRDILRFAKEYPETGPQIGVIPCDSNSFFMNSTLYSEFCGMKQNSMNRDLRQHGFVIDKECNIGLELRNRFPQLISTSRQWVKRIFRFGSFNGQSSDEEVAIATEVGRQVRNHHISVPIREETVMNANRDVTDDAAVEIEGESGQNDIWDTTDLTDAFSFSLDSVPLGSGWLDNWDGTQFSILRL